MYHSENPYPPCWSGESTEAIDQLTRPELSFNPFNPSAYAQADNSSNISHENHSQLQHSFVSFNPCNYMQVEDPSVTFNNAMPMEILFNPNLHIEAADLSMSFNSVNHLQNGGYPMFSNLLDLLQPQILNAQDFDYSAQSLRAC